MEITSAVVYKPQLQTALEKKTVDVFCKNLKKRSGVSLLQSKTSGKISIEFYKEDSCSEEIKALFDGITVPGKEGFRIRVIDNPDGSGRIVVLGKDERGEFYGMARLLRKAIVKKDSIEIPDELDSLSMTPQYPLRGHQLGYRDKNNTYGAWSKKEFEAYIEDLALFGANAIELLPPKTDDRLYSALFPEDPMELMCEVSKIIHSYGMDVWLWYPNVGRDYHDFGCIDREMEERRKVFSAIPYLDAMLVPLGDPGSLWPTDAMRLTEHFVEILHEYHPEAGVWVAPQHFQPEPGWYDTFYEEIAKEPDWITGVCFAPWEQDSIEELYEKLPEKYRENIRNYPDISHNSNCQFPVENWDMAFALTSGREGYNARPEKMKAIHNMLEPYTIGSITYSEGIHDDVNKILWADQDFDSSVAAEETMADYANLFIDSETSERVAEFLMDVEHNWDGPVLENDGIDALYESFTAFDKTVSKQVKNNYRYQMLKLRILTDYWTKQKYAKDQELEQQARAVLDLADITGSEAVIREARTILNLSRDVPAAEDVLFEMLKLADSLRNLCGIQLTENHHGGQCWIRGAYLQTRSMPLNDYQYLMQSFKRIEKMQNEKNRCAALHQLNLRQDPGDGNQFCALGTYEGFSHVSVWHSWEEDPGYLKTPFIDHSVYTMVGLLHEIDGWYHEFPMPLTWALNVTVLYGTPLEMTFTGLDPEASYGMKVFYPNSFFRAFVGQTALKDETLVNIRAGKVLLADRIAQNPNGKSVRREIEAGREPFWEYDLPKESYQDGTLKVRWEVYDTLKALAVSEVWIMKKE